MSSHAAVAETYNYNVGTAPLSIVGYIAAASGNSSSSSNPVSTVDLPALQPLRSGTAASVYKEILLSGRAVAASAVTCEVTSGPSTRVNFDGKSVMEQNKESISSSSSFIHYTVRNDTGHCSLILLERNIASI